VPIITDDSQNRKKNYNIFTKIRPTVIPMAFGEKSQLIYKQAAE
jgi:hypothetical protein